LEFDGTLPVELGEGFQQPHSGGYLGGPQGDLKFNLQRQSWRIGGLEHFFSIQLGMSSSQLTNSHFSEG